MINRSRIAKIACIAAGAILASAGQAQILQRDTDAWGVGFLLTAPADGPGSTSLFDVNIPFTSGNAGQGIVWSFGGGNAYQTLQTSNAVADPNDPNFFFDSAFYLWDSSQELLTALNPGLNEPPSLIGGFGVDGDEDPATPLTFPTDYAVESGNDSEATIVSFDWDDADGIPLPTQPDDTKDPLRINPTTFDAIAAQIEAVDGSVFNVPGTPVDLLVEPVAVVNNDGSFVHPIADVASAQAANAFVAIVDVRYTADITGACCDAGVCTDFSLEGDCDTANGATFDANLECDQINCFEAAVGACCDSFGCTDFPTPIDPVAFCIGAGGTFFENASCADDLNGVNGPDICEPKGACCEIDGTCSDDILVEFCSDDGDRWSEGELCADVDCGPTGACCDTARGICLDFIAMEDCGPSNRRDFSDGQICANITCTDSNSGSVQMLAIDLSGQASWDDFGDADNVILNANIGANSEIIGIMFDVNLDSIDPSLPGESWLSEMTIDITDSSGELIEFNPAEDGVNLAFVLPNAPGAENYAGDLNLDVANVEVVGNSFQVEADGDITLELYELFDDAADTIDALWGANSTVTLVYFQGAAAEPCPGDANGDNMVTLADFSAVLSNFGAGPGATREQGDVTGDGNVSLADFSQVLSNFGQPCP